jgi:uncharacterized protein YcaQ
MATSSSPPVPKRRRTRLSAAEARRIALAAQGFAEPALGRAVDTRALRSRVIDRVGLIQIDSVNVLQRAHYLPAFARLGAYDTDLLDKLSHYAPRRLFEYWGHEASLIPVELHPHLRWRMRRAHDDAWGGMRRVAQERPELVAAVLEDLRDRGPLTAAQLGHLDEPRGKKGPWWDWSDVKRSLEFLFWSGEITSARRRRFERLYDVPERVLPAAVLNAPTPDDDEAQRELLRVAARSLGIATEPDLRDYFRLPAADAKLRVPELVEAGDLLAVTVEGWDRPAWLDPRARMPRKVEARALLAPFDPLVWERDRTHRIFDFFYRIGIYTPVAKRTHGYYVLPFLLGDRLVARVDLKADRANSKLLVHAAHLEDGQAAAQVAGPLREELRLMADWLGLESVSLPRAGALAKAMGRMR